MAEVSKMIPAKNDWIISEKDDPLNWLKLNTRNISRQRENTAYTISKRLRSK